MSENKIEERFTEEMQEYIRGLVQKSVATIEKSQSSANSDIATDGVNIPVRVDDHQLLFIGCVLLPNIVNYLVNILPQFIYPYVVAYLQDLSNMSEDPVTISELYNFLKEICNGNLLKRSETEGEKECVFEID